MEIRVDNRLRLLVGGLDRGALKELEDAFTHDNPQHERLKRIDPRAAFREPRQIRTWAAEGNPVTLTLPRGGAPRLRSVLREAGVEFRFVDCRGEGSANWHGCIPEHAVTLYPFQEEMVGAAVQRENCLWRSPTGSGKTTAALGFIARVNVPTLIVVWTGNLLEQWRQRIVKELGTDDVGIIGKGKFSLRPVTVAMQQTLNRMSDEKWGLVNEVFGAVVCDEVQRFAATTFLKTVDRMKARYRLGVSASERRKDGKEFLIYDEFGDVVGEVDHDELVDQKYILDVEVRVVPTEFRAPWYAEQREAYARAMREKTKRPPPPDFNALLDAMVADEERNELAVRTAIHEVEAGHAVLMFSHRREHCLRFDSMVTAEGARAGRLLGSKEDEAEFARTAEGLVDGTVRLGAGTFQAIGHGIDLPRVDRAVIATPAAQNKQFWAQVRGRLCRTAAGKTDAVAYYLWDEDVGLTPLENLRRWNDVVTVWHRGDWVPVVEYLKEARR